MHITHTLFFTLIFTFFATHAADDKIITLQSNDGASITLPTSVAKYSGTLSNIIEDCPSEQIILLNKFNQHELKLLVYVLHNIGQSISKKEEETINILRYNFMGNKSDITPMLLALSYLEDFFDIHLLQQALLEYMTYIPSFPKKSGFRGNETIARSLKKLQKACTQNNFSLKDQKGFRYLAHIIEDAQLADKKRFLESKGEIKGPFFTGVSVGDLVAHGLINIQYEPIYKSIFIKNDIPFVQARVEYPQEIPMSIEGLICSAPSIPGIKQKKKMLVISDTGISHLPANSFQRVSNPEVLFIIYNKLVAIHPEAFAGLHTLTKLKVWNGSSDIFTHMPVGTLDHLKNLMSLELGDTSFNPLLLKYCSKLKKLLLCRNHLAELPARWPKACAALEKITIIKNNIPCIPLSFLNHFPLLQNLSLANNKIKHIHANIFKDCQNLTFLNLYGNPIPQKEIKALRTALPHIEIEF